MTHIPVSANDIAASSGYDPSTGTVVALETGPATTDANGTYAPLFIEDVEQGGYIALSSPPTTTNTGSDTALTFSQQVSHVILENHTSTNVYYAFDTTASAGTLKLLPGSTLIYPKRVTVVHLYTAASQNINGTTDGNIVVLGAL